MPKKKPAKSGYWQFVLECRDKQNTKHGKQMNWEEIQSYAARKWATMSKEERQPYDIMAQHARNEYLNTQSKLTTDGLEIDELERREKELMIREEEMKNDISKILKSAHFASILDEQVFLIIHINHLTFCTDPERYFICEIAIAAMSLRNGVEDVFHKIVHPGELPKGYLGGAMAHSKETHQLLDLVNDEENNTFEVFQAMIHFLKKHVSKNTVPILYADEKILDMTRNVIYNFRQDFNYKDEIKVYNLPFMFFALRNVVAGKNVWPTVTFSYSQLEKDIYCYSPNISCDFHEMADLTVQCSKSIVIRTVYTICDHCCADLRVDLVPGFHVPSKSKVVSESKTSSKAGSVCSNDGYRSAAASRVDSYDDSFPPMRSSASTASSVISFASMRTAPTSTKTAARLEHSFKALSFKEAVKRDHTNTNFPAHGAKKYGN